MEKADANGFVNVTWPSKSVPHGGIFHTRVVDPSSAQQQFLRVLLEESKLTVAQRRKSALALREYECKEVPRYEAPTVRPRTSRRRSLSAIRQSGALESDGYRPMKRGEDRELLKERLANAMTYGHDEQRPPPAPRLIKPPAKLPTNKEKWNNLVTQIRERAEWLAEMEELGEAGPHREMVKDQIAERLRALDALGIDSVCSSARSNKSGFSVLDYEPKSDRSKGSVAKSVHSSKSTSSQNKRRLGDSTRKCKEENVMAYNKLSPLQYSPRRRV
ncbi:UPF0193 protein EVG1 homolog [Epargyreus clarus]|uniref:UPF0193 protein EVG1 homolog n=1 Tax=Epargyreus clarus TaxID=520877 RepID=UPI003C2E2192